MRSGYRLGLGVAVLFIGCVFGGRSSLTQGEIYTGLEKCSREGVIMPNLPDPTLLAIPAFVLFVALEWWGVQNNRLAGTYDTKDAWTSMVMGLGSSVTGVLFGGGAYVMSLWIWDTLRLTEIAFTALSFAGLLMLNDFLYYWKHRAMHRVRWFWANHVVHHSSNFYNLTTALRQPWTGPISGLFIIGLPQVILGFHPAVVAFAGGVNLLYQFWIHTEAIDRLPHWVEFIFNTPSHHRAHHGRNPRYLDTNYGGILIVWDRLFGTFVAELERDRPDYGLVSPLRSHNPMVVAVHEYGELAKDLWKDGWRIWHWPGRLFGPPGWSPEGHHQGSRALKEKYLKACPEDRGHQGFRHI